MDDISTMDSIAATENAEKTGKQQRNWTRQDLHTNLPPFPEANFSKYGDFTAQELF